MNSAGTLALAGVSKLGRLSGGTPLSLPREPGPEPNHGTGLYGLERWAVRNARSPNVPRCGTRSTLHPWYTSHVCASTLGYVRICAATPVRPLMSGTDAPLSDNATRVHIDTTKPSLARCYDAALGGKDNYEVDREFIRRLEQVTPEIGQFTWDNRNFLIRVTRFLASEAGITQCLDCGSGLPTAENTHQVAQRIQPDARVVYIDNDPIVLAHGRALLEENDQTHFSDADIFKPRQVINDEIVRRYLDFSEPIALFQLGTLHHYDGEPSPQSIMAEYIDALPSGSYVAISHFFDPETTSELSELARKMEQVFLNSPIGSGWFRTRADIEGMFPGLELVDPGLTRCADWWPDGPRIKPFDPVQHCLVGAVGRKP
jgi:S-adenosyl methyltransferase